MSKKKLNKKAVTRVVTTLNAHRDEMIDAFDEATSTMKRAKSVNGVMKAKKQLLLDILDSFPLGANCCYFCELDIDCDECEYAKKYGKCSNEDSSFNKIDSTWIELEKLIGETYW